MHTYTTVNVVVEMQLSPMGSGCRTRKDSMEDSLEMARAWLAHDADVTGDVLTTAYVTDTTVRTQTCAPKGQARRARALAP